MNSFKAQNSLLFFVEKIQKWLFGAGGDYVVLYMSDRKRLKKFKVMLQSAFPEYKVIATKNYDSAYTYAVSSGRMKAFYSEYSNWGKVLLLWAKEDLEDRENCFIAYIADEREYCQDPIIGCQVSCPNAFYHLNVTTDNIRKDYDLHIKYIRGGG